MTDQSTPEISLEQGNLARIMTSHLLDGIIVINQQGIILDFSIPAERIFGYSKDEVLGKNVSMLMPEPHARQHDGYIQNYLRTGRAKIIGIGREVKGRRKDGTLFDMDLGITDAEYKGNRIFVGIVRDITKQIDYRAQIQRMQKEVDDKTTELKRLEDTLLRQRTMAMITEMVGGVSHELNNPLMGLMGYIEALGKKYAHDTENKEYFERSAELCSRIVDIVGSMSEIQTMSLDLLSYDSSAVDTGLVLQEVIDEILVTDIGKGAQIVNDCESSRYRIKINPNALKSVLENVLKNSLEAAHRNGVLPEIRVDVTPADRNHVTIRIEDNGQGLTEDQINWAFQPFFTVKERNRSNGLGLFVARTLVESFGGNIDISTIPNRGAAVVMQLPILITD